MLAATQFAQAAAAVAAANQQMNLAFVPALGPQGEPTAIPVATFNHATSTYGGGNVDVQDVYDQVGKLSRESVRPVSSDWQLREAETF